MRFSITILACFIASVATAALPPGHAKRSKKPNPSLVAGCAVPTGSEELNINNNRALIHTGGDMFWDLVSQPRYEIPKNSGRNALFASSLWLGGRDVSGQLKVAANRFRGNGQDFWTGPLSTVDAEITAQTCEDYDMHFVTTRNMVAEFVGWYEAGEFDRVNGTSTQQENFPDYQIPEVILNWPAHGRDYAPFNEDFYLAPFIDRDGDGTYDPSGAGDYPAYDLGNEQDCQQRIVNIYGDQNLWWIFNDKGNVHTETGSQSIGMEIRAQAFAFATSDEVNNMTFYNYELVNRSTFSLTDTYFGYWVDADLGYARDDYVGCDVTRGLGYAYNGDNFDEDASGRPGYGAIPPAIGVDFFQGPFQDADGVDNPLTQKFTEAIANDGIPYAGIGIGYGDGVIDNERFGMRKFLYHNNGGQIRAISDPNSGVEYYNYLRGIWLDGSRMEYGGTGYNQGNGITADYMFPGTTDTLGWGTGGSSQPDWTEVTAGNAPDDRRFIQSAGPFTLEPGAVNNITVGIVWARAKSGTAESSVQVLRQADDKTQALFDNCFQLINGPDAPNLVVRELDKEIILMIDNPLNSNNYKEQYREVDPAIIAPDSLTASQKEDYQSYTFQGYQIYQVKDQSVGANDLQDIEVARLIAQCDITDSISQIVNYTFNEDIGATEPSEMVNGANEGITHSFKITTDAFAEGDAALVNHKAYYFIAIAYAYNNFKPFDPADEISQSIPYLASRQSPNGPIRTYTAIPHSIKGLEGGTKLNAAFGDELEVTQLEGKGNGANFTQIKASTIDEIMAGEPWKADDVTFEKGAGPIKITVADPLNIVGGTYTIRMLDSTTAATPAHSGATRWYTHNHLTDAYWVLYGGNIEDTIYSYNTVAANSDQLVLDLGIAVEIKNAPAPATEEARNNYNNGVIGGEIEYADPSKEWISFIEDQDGQTSANWILAGVVNEDADNPLTDINELAYNDWYFPITNDDRYYDPNQDFEQILNGAVGPFRLTNYLDDNGPMPESPDPSSKIFSRLPSPTVPEFDNQLNYLHGVNIVLTDDKDLWTRCPVIEMRDTIAESQGNAVRGMMRDAPSIDKEGNFADTSASPSSDPDSPNYIASKGMGWFPGYAIDVETGERLNMAYGEDSYLAKENGADMQWNPTSNYVEGPYNEIRAGGKHIVYVFRNNIIEDDAKPFPLDFSNTENLMPSYDAGQFSADKLGSGTEKGMIHFWTAGMWTMIPLLEEGQELLATEVTVKIRVTRPFQNYVTIGDRNISFGDDLEVGKNYFVNKGPVKHIISSDKDSIFYHGNTFTAVSSDFTLESQNGTASFDSTDVLIESENGGRPMYQFNMDDLAPEFGISELAEDALGDIYVVPNPYYAYSSYETTRLDNRVRIINLPEQCSIKIYAVNGTLVRSFEKDDATISSLDWDLKNQSQVSVASGVYFIHVDAPGIGERVLKWFGVMRPYDLDNF